MKFIQQTRWNQNNQNHNDTDQNRQPLLKASQIQSSAE